MLISRCGWGPEFESWQVMVNEGYMTFETERIEIRLGGQRLSHCNYSLNNLDNTFKTNVQNLGQLKKVRSCSSIN